MTITCQFLYFNYSSRSRSAKTQVTSVKPRRLIAVDIEGKPVDRLPSKVTQVVEVPSSKSRSITHLVILSDFYIDILSLDISERSPVLIHLKNMKN